jgi:TonB family protein
MRLLIAIIVLAAFASGQTGPIAGPVYRIGNGVSQPKLLSKVEPKYSEEARQAKWQGTVQLSLIVEEDGSASDVKVSRPLGLGLDENAIDAVKQWRFQPGLKEGKPVRVIATVQVNFRLVDDFAAGLPIPGTITPMGLDPPRGLNAVPPPADPERSAAAEELVSLMNPEEMAQQAVTITRPILEAALGRVVEQNLPKAFDRTLIAGDIQSLQRELVDRFAANTLSHYKSLLIGVYAGLFSVQEIRDITAFYRTPSGHTLASKMPEIGSRVNAAGQQSMQRMNPEITKLISDWMVNVKKKYGFQ